MNFLRGWCLLHGARAQVAGLAGCSLGRLPFHYNSVTDVVKQSEGARCSTLCFVLSAALQFECRGVAGATGAIQCAHVAGNGAKRKELQVQIEIEEENRQALLASLNALMILWHVSQPCTTCTVF